MSDGAVVHSHPCIASSTTPLHNTGLRPVKVYCRCIYDLFTFWAYLQVVNVPRWVLRHTGYCSFLSDNAVARINARKNKTHCMTNTHVIHSQSMEELDSMEYSTNPDLARFISPLYPQKIITPSFKRPEDLGNVTGDHCSWHLAVMQKVCSITFKDSGTMMTAVWEGLTAMISPFSTAALVSVHQ